MGRPFFYFHLGVNSCFLIHTLICLNQCGVVIFAGQILWHPLSFKPFKKLFEHGYAPLDSIIELGKSMPPPAVEKMDH